MSFPIFQVDAFSDSAFAGNPAAVVVMDEERSTEWMQNIAAEMNLSETAFVRHLSDNRYALRWFTPGMEVDLCGHATIATAHVLWTQGYASTQSPLVFDSRSGDLPVRYLDGLVQLDFPATPAEECAAPSGLVESFEVAGVSIVPDFVGRSRFDYLVVLDSESQVRNLDVDFRRLAACECRGVIVTAASNETQDCDFVSRFFAPAANVDEDPVTGSAHCCLSVYWSARMGQDSLTGYQASARGGYVRITMQNDRVLLRGNAVTILKGELLV